MNFIIPYHIYPFDLMVSIGETDAELKKALKEYGTEWLDDYSYEDKVEGRFVMNKKHQSLLRVPRKPTNPQDKGVLAHEIFHAVEFVLDRIGLPHTLETGEAYAYLIDYITTEIYKKLK